MPNTELKLSKILMLVIIESSLYNYLLMGRFNTNLLEVKLAVQIYDKDSKTYNGYYRARLGCVACGVDEEYFFNYPPENEVYEGLRLVSPQMLDDAAWVYAGTMATALCSHVEKSQAGRRTS